MPPLTKTCFSPMKLRSDLNIVLKSNFKIMDTHRNNAKFFFPALTINPTLKFHGNHLSLNSKSTSLHDAWFIKRFIRQRLAPTVGPHFSNSLPPTNTPVQVHLCNDFIKVVSTSFGELLFYALSIWNAGSCYSYISEKEGGGDCFFRKNGMWMFLLIMARDNGRVFDM